MSNKNFLSDDEMRASHGNIPGLNGLRAVSILLVTFSHLGLEKALPGWFGVNIFFFISGFLITRLLIADMEEYGSIDLRLFYLRRFFRLFPALISLVILCILIAIVEHVHIRIYAVLSTIFYFANYVRIFSPRSLETINLVHTWSLSIEEHFYLFYPLLLILCFSRNVPATRVITSLIILAFSLRFVDHVILGKIATDYIYNATETRMDFLLFGSLATFICHGSSGKRFIDIATDGRVFALAICMLVASFVIKAPLFKDAGRFTVQSTALFFLIPALVYREKFMFLKMLLNNPVSDWIGKISYSLYLFQVPILNVMNDWAANWPLAHPLNRLAGYAIGFMLSILAAAASYYFIETPVLRWRRRLQRKSIAPSSAVRTVG